jgi:dephospho-CoA kinase
LEKIGESAKIRKIAVTGTISAGKSTVCDYLSNHQAFVLKADVVVQNLLSQDNNVILKIKEKFGNDCLTNGEVDRKKLANQVFRNPEKLKVLEEILHPLVQSKILETYDQIKDKTEYKAFVVEIPLLFEIKFESFFDEVWYVTAKKEICKKRFLERGFSESDFEARFSRFDNEDEKLKKSHKILVNNLFKEDLINQIENIL